MIYISYFKKYLIIFIKILLFFLIIFLFYFFINIIYLNDLYNDYLLKTIKNLLLLIFNSLPFIIMFSLFIFTSSLYPNNRKDNIIIILIVSLFNSLLVLSYVLVRFNIPDIPDKREILRKIDLKQNYINILNNSSFTINMPIRNYNSILFMDNVYFINNAKIENSNVILKSEVYIVDDKIFKKENIFRFNYISNLKLINETYITRELFRKYIITMNNIKDYFVINYQKINPLFIFLSLFIIICGLTYFILGISIFFYDVQLLIINLSALFIISILFLFVFSSIINSTNVIKISLNKPFLNIFLPSLIMTIILSIIGYGLNELKILLSKNYNKR